MIFFLYFFIRKHLVWKRWSASWLSCPARGPGLLSWLSSQTADRFYPVFFRFLDFSRLLDFRGEKLFIDMSVTWVDWNTINHFWSWCDYNIVFEKHLFVQLFIHHWSWSSLVLVIIVYLRWQVKGGQGSCWEGARKALSEGAPTPCWGGGWWSLLPPGQCAWLAQIPALDFPIPQLYLRPIFYTLKWSHCRYKPKIH